MSRSFRRSCCAALALLFLVAAACGQEEDGGGDESKAARADYIEQAGLICESANEEFNALFETDFPTIKSKAPAFFEKAVPIVESRMNELKELNAPEGDEEEIQSMLDSGDKAVEDFKRAATDEQLAADLFAQEGGENSLAFEDQAEDYGIEPCASDEGGGADEEPPARVDTSAFSAEKRAYIERVDAVCRATNERLAPIEATVFAEFPPSGQAWRQGLPQLVPIVRSQMAEIKAISPPAADRPAVDAITQQQDELTVRLDEALAAANSGDDNRLGDALQPVFAQFDEVDESYRRFGFQVCGALDEEEEEEGEEG